MIKLEAIEARLADVVRSKYGDNGIEYLVGALSSLTTMEQLTTLVNANTPKEEGKPL